MDNFHLFTESVSKKRTSLRCAPASPVTSYNLADLLVLLVGHPPGCLRPEKEGNIPPKKECPIATPNKKGSAHRKKEDEPQVQEGRPDPGQNPAQEGRPTRPTPGTRDSPNPEKEGQLPKRELANPKCKKKKKRSRSGTRWEARPQRRGPTRNTKRKNPTSTQRKKPTPTPDAPRKKTRNVLGHWFAFHEMVSFLDKMLKKTLCITVAACNVLLFQNFFSKTKKNRSSKT